MRTKDVSGNLSNLTGDQKAVAESFPKTMAEEDKSMESSSKNNVMGLKITAQKLALSAYRCIPEILSLDKETIKKYIIRILSIIQKQLKGHENQIEELQHELEQFFEAKMNAHLLAESNEQDLIDAAQLVMTPLITEDSSSKYIAKEIVTNLRRNLVNLLKPNQDKIDQYTQLLAKFIHEQGLQKNADFSLTELHQELRQLLSMEKYYFFVIVTEEQGLEKCVQSAITTIFEGSQPKKLTAMEELQRSLAANEKEENKNTSNDSDIPNLLSSKTKVSTKDIVKKVCDQIFQSIAKPKQDILQDAILEYVREQGENCERLKDLPHCLETRLYLGQYYRLLARVDEENLRCAGTVGAIAVFEEPGVTVSSPSRTMSTNQSLPSNIYTPADYKPISLSPAFFGSNVDISSLSEDDKRDIVFLRKMGRNPSMFFYHNRVNRNEWLELYMETLSIILKERNFIHDRFILSQALDEFYPEGKREELERCLYIIMTEGEYALKNYLKTIPFSIAKLEAQYKAISGMPRNTV